ncbi:MAG: DNA/RNA non-specific endonuclease [Methylococcales bacterium]|nr:DNA/RNA non-specific endonuclease [Methylococcales bacterium]
MILRIMALLLLGSTVAHAHGGKTNAEGCHTEKATGNYHCHNGTKPTPAIVPTKPVNTPAQTPLATDTKPNSAGIMKLDYEGFTVWLDCSKRGAVKFQYNAQHDTGNAKRSDSFYLDPNVPAECQQTTDKAYGNKYDRGHLVPANHLDSSETAIKATNTMTNILPQAANMNRGAWLATEELIECYRDIDELLVIGGVIWGNNSSDDYFIKSHGVATPEAFYKVVIRGKGQSEKAIAWIVPNSQDATRKNLDKYIVTVDDIERITGESIPVADYAKHDKPSESWIIPKGCNKS